MVLQSCLILLPSCCLPYHPFFLFAWFSTGILVAALYSSCGLCRLYHCATGRAPVLVFAGADGSVLHPKLVATHTSVIDAPSCDFAFDGAITKWTPVAMPDAVRDSSVVHPKLVTTHISVIDAPSCNCACDGAITNRTLVLIVARTFFCLPLRLAAAHFGIWRGPSVRLFTAYFAFHGLPFLFACGDNTCSLGLYLGKHFVFSLFLALCSCAGQPCIGFGCGTACHHQLHAPVACLSAILIFVFLCENVELGFVFLDTTVCTGPVVACSARTLLTNAAGSMSHFPGSSTKIFFESFLAKKMARCPCFAGATHGVETTPVVLMFLGKRLFGLPQFAHVALPWSACSSTTVTAFTANSFLLRPSPLPHGEAGFLLPFVARDAPALLCILCQQCLPIDHVPRQCWSNNSLPSGTPL